MTTLAGSPDGKDVQDVDITTIGNTSYGVIKNGRRLQVEYELVGNPPGSPPGGYVNVVPSPPPPFHQPLPPQPVATPTPRNVCREEAVYEPVPGDK